MQHQEMLSKAIRYQKTASDNAFSIISILQNSSEQMLKTTLDQCSWIPEKGQEDYLSFSQNYLQITEKIKTYIDKGYEEAEWLFVRAEKAVPAQNKLPVRQKATPTPPITPPVASKLPSEAFEQNGEKQEKAPE